MKNNHFSDMHHNTVLDSKRVPKDMCIQIHHKHTAIPLWLRSSEEDGYQTPDSPDHRPLPQVVF